MTTVHHVPHAYHADLTSAEINRPLGELDSAIETVITTGSGASTTLTAQANAGQASLTVASSAEFAVGDPIYIGTGAMFESRIVATVPGGGVTITVTVNLSNTYAIGKPVSKSPVEIVDARDGFTTLGANLEAKIGAVVDRGAGLFGITDTPSKRMPVNLGAPMVGPDIVAAGGTSNVIGFQFSPRFTGSLAGIGGLDPGYVWGVSIFTTDGPAAADGDGIVDLTGFVSEIALQSSVADQTVIRAGHFNLSLWGASSGGHVAQMEGVRISTPAFKDSAVSGNWTIDAVYGLFVEDPGTVGTNRFAIYTGGGPSRFTGRLDVDGGLAFLTAGVFKSTLRSGSYSPEGLYSGIAGDIWFRTDTPSTANQRIYVCTGTTNWTGIA